MRPSRTACFELESRALTRLAATLASDPTSILQRLVELLRETLRAGSAGISLLSDGDETCHWPAIAGAWQPPAGGRLPRNDSPCALVLDSGAVQLLRFPERVFPSLTQAELPIHEALVAPFHVDGAAVGTIWVMAHDDERKFDSEDARLIVSLGTFAAAGFQVLESIAAAHREEDGDVARARLAAIVDSSDDAIVSKTLDGVITSWNQSAARMFGYSAEEAVGRHISLIIPSQRLGEEEEVLARLRRGERIDHFETERQTKDGRLLAISLTVSPVRDRRGKIVGASKVARDVSERIRNEREREQLMASVDRARDDAVEANRTKDEFLAVVSHELRSPLNAMLGWVRVLKTSRNRDASLIDRAVDTLERNIAVQAQVINDLLDVSRILSGKLELDHQRLDFTSLVAGCVESLRPSAEGKGVSLALDIAYHAEIMGDAARMEQVIFNLLGNAIKFTDPGGAIVVRVERGGDSSARLAIADTGMGIGPEFLPYLFERFRQAEGSSVRKHGGLGLGLSIVHHLVTLHNGTIMAQSEGLGRGSRFSVTLPIAEDQRRMPARSARLAESSDTRIDLDVLVVEDDADTRFALELALTDHGARVRSSASVREALTQYRARRPDLLISDVGMPGEDGYALIRAIRDLEEGHDHRTLAIAVTGFAGPQDHAMALRAGFDAHVAKPLAPDLLLERVRVLAAARDVTAR